MALIISAERLKRICFSCLKRVGCSDYEANRVTDLLVWSNLRGHDSHGVGVRMPEYIEAIKAGNIRLGAKMEIEKETPIMALINGNFGIGQVIATEAMETAIEKAGRSGIGIVSIFNCNHIGRLADYAEMTLKHNMIGFVVANTRAGFTAPYGGARAVFGSNPLCFSVPAGEEEPIIVDFATSVFAGGKLKVASARGERLPEGVLLDSEGFPTTDPDVYAKQKKGVLLPFGGIVGFKGYGLCLIADVLGGALSGSGCGSLARTNGVFMLAMDLAQFGLVEKFKAAVDGVIRECKAAPLAHGYDGFKGVKRVLIPGEPERITEKNSLNSIYIDEPTWNRMVDTAKEINVDVEGIP